MKKKYYLIFKIIEILKYCYDNNIPITINTAASQKSIEWYEKAFDANLKARWIFGVDGLPKDSHKYRINQDGEKLFEMAKLCAKMGLPVSWQYLVFNYNENDIETCRKMAKDNNIKFDVSGFFFIFLAIKNKNKNHPRDYFTQLTDP